MDKFVRGQTAFWCRSCMKDDLLPYGSYAYAVAYEFNPTMPVPQLDPV